MTTDLTVLEFAEKHADECGCGTDRAKHIAADVDALIEAATVAEKVLWRVVFDSDGRASLLWIAYPEEAWMALMRKASQVQALRALFGLRS